MVGYIDIDDLRSVMRQVQQQLSEAQLQRILASSTSNTPGRLSPDDFYRLMTSSSFFG